MNTKKLLSSFSSLALLTATLGAASTAHAGGVFQFTPIDPLTAKGPLNFAVNESVDARKLVPPGSSVDNALSFLRGLGGIGVDGNAGANAGAYVDLAPYTTLAGGHMKAGANAAVSAWASGLNGALAFNQWASVTAEASYVRAPAPMFRCPKCTPSSPDTYRAFLDVRGFDGTVTHLLNESATFAGTKSDSVFVVLPDPIPAAAKRTDINLGVGTIHLRNFFQGTLTGNSELTLSVVATGAKVDAFAQSNFTTTGQSDNAWLVFVGYLNLLEHSNIVEDDMPKAEFHASAMLAPKTKSGVLSMCAGYSVNGNVHRAMSVKTINAIYNPASQKSEYPSLTNIDSAGEDWGYATADEKCVAMP